jgi:hypothetical protein
VVTVASLTVLGGGYWGSVPRAVRRMRRIDVRSALARSDDQLRAAVRNPRASDRHGSVSLHAAADVRVALLLQRRPFVLEMDAAGLSLLWVRDASASSSSMSRRMVASV